MYNCLGPNPPIVSVDPIYHPFMLPQLTATIAGQLLWRGYDISEFNVDITNGSDDSLLYHLTVPNNSSGNNTATVNINQTMLESTAEQCYSLKVYTSAVSRLYGLSEPTLVETAVFRGRLECTLMGMWRLTGHHQMVYTV